MGLFENIAVVDLKLQLAFLAGGVVYAICVFIDAVIGDIQAFQWSVVIGACLGLLIEIAVYRRLPS